MRTIVTGGAGFIGSALVRRLVGDGHHVLNIDKLTYAGRAEALASLADAPNYKFTQIDIADSRATAHAFRRFDPDLVFNLAAESHVDRSIEGSAVFVATNIVGAHSVLEASLDVYEAMDPVRRGRFRVIHVSTDEVYGSLGPEGAFTEESQVAPNSPYAASKAAADHLARAWYQTYGLPVAITNCTNNYGPWQHPEKFIPTVIRSALSGATIPIYGDGSNVRDWIHVDDHVEGLLLAARRGRAGERYNFGARDERSNLDLTRLICAALDRLAPRGDGLRHEAAIGFVEDRPGHDFRYAVDPSKAERELGWSPRRPFRDGLAATVAWYVANPQHLERPPQELARRGAGRQRGLGN